MHSQFVCFFVGFVSISVVLFDPPECLAQSQTISVSVREGTEESFRGTYGGADRADSIADGCSGYIAEDPNFALEVEFEGWVRVSVESGANEDTTLVLEQNGVAICNDDASTATLDPEILTYLEAGTYSVYVGSIAPNEHGRFRITFADATEATYPVVTGDRDLTLYGVSGGLVDASNRGTGCVGTIGQRPSHIIQVGEPMLLDINASSNSDLTLVIIGSGDVWCNDDAVGTLNPRIVDWFSEGMLRIFVGSHNPRVEAMYSLNIMSSSNY